MNININKCDNKYIVAVDGRLDTNTAPELEAALNDIIAEDILLACEAMEYVSSAGLRVILALHKRLAAQGRCLTLRGIRPEVRSVLDMTGFSRILQFE
ncbi:MAG: STAS domain-containing protein [Alistipes sp.]|nr:STAS domain-containing protein [Alistipes sp.]